MTRFFCLTKFFDMTLLIQALYPKEIDFKKMIKNDHCLTKQTNKQRGPYKLECKGKFMSGNLKNNQFRNLESILRLFKGQLISKCLFGVFDSSKKTERKQFDLRYHSSWVEFFRLFLQELRIHTKKSF